MSQDVGVVDNIEEVATEPVMEEATDTLEESTVDVDIDELPIDEFNKTLSDMLEGGVDTELDEEAIDEPSDDNGQDKDLEGLYRSQIDDTDSSFDKPVYLKINGEVMEVSNINDLRNLAEQGAGAQRAFQQIAKDVKTIDFLRDNDISMEDLNAVIANRGVTPKYREEIPPATMQVNKLIEEIEHAPYRDEFISSVEQLPAEVTKEIGSNPALLHDLAKEFSEGYAQKIMPHIKKEMAIKGLPFIEAYKSVGLRLLDYEERKAGVDKDKVSSQPKPKQSVPTRVDVDKMSTEEFNRYIAKLRK
jgi:hypothetical protein